MFVERDRLAVPVARDAPRAFARTRDARPIRSGATARRADTFAKMSGPRRVEPPVFYPTLEEMRTMSLEKYVESIEEQLEEYGIGRIVPPKGWTPRKRGYDDVDFTVEKAITQHATGRKGLFRTLLVEKKPLSIKRDFKPMAELPENQPSKAALEDPTHAALEREFWKKVAYDPPTYCADVAGTLFDAPEERGDGDDATRVTEGWDVSRLDSLLSRTLKEKNITLKGVNSSYLYFGMWRALFAWHTEDCDLYSVNYLHYGAPKFWYAVAPEDRERFEILAQGMVPEMWRACPEFLRHKELLISPTLLEQNGIPFTRMMQRPGEFVVTYPGSYHSGFNCGYNCAESCNFATEAWVEIGEDAGVCECVPDAVSLDMRIFGDLCTRCHDTDEDDSETDEEDSETEEASESGAAANERGGARRARLASSSSGGRATRKRAASVSSDDEEKEKEKERKKRAKLMSNSKPAVCQSEKKLSAAAAEKEKRRGDGGAAKKVLVPEGWTRSVVMRGARGAPPPAGPGRPRSAAGDRDTYYTSPDGVVVKSKYEVVKYLGSNLTNLTPRDFYFESRPEDAPPARLHVASPATPSPTASADGARRGSSGERKRSEEKEEEKESRRRQKVVDQKQKASSEKSRRGSGGRDALGLLRSATLSANASNASNAQNAARGRELKKPPNGANRVGKKKLFFRERERDSKPGSGSLKVLTAAERAAGLAVGAETFSSWKAGGVLERAVCDVMRRAGSMGKYARGIRGSSLVMQVEQALGVGSGALRGHGRQIQSLAQANASRVTPRRRA